VVDDVDGDGIYNPGAGDTYTYQRDEDDAAINSGRLPPNHRLDLRLEYTPRPRRIAWTFYLDILNAYGRENVYGYYYNADFSQRKPDEGFPILPSIGVRARF